MKKLQVALDKDNPNIIIVSGSATKNLKQFLKSNYGAVYDTVDRQWLIPKDVQKFNIDEHKLYAQLKAKSIDREVQREFGKLIDEDDEDSILRYGKAALVYLEKINLTTASKAKDELYALRAEAKASGTNLDTKQEATLSFLNATLLAANALIKTKTMEIGKEGNIAYFPNWEDRESLAKELNNYRRIKIFNKTSMSNTAKEELDEEESYMQR